MSDDFHPGNELTLIDRSTTCKRILFTIFFFFVIRLLEVVLAFIVLFELVYSLITQRPPNPRVPRFAHRILRYGFDVGQYVTFNKNELPFPFDDLPNGIEPINAGSAAT